jgi:phage baseplate assembly protein W
MENPNPIRGMSFPFRIDPQSGGVATAVDGRKIGMNLRTILSTRIGERPMLRDFGSQLHALVHEANEPALARSLTKHLQEALLAWERRVVVTNTTARHIEGELHLIVRFRHVDAQEEGEVAIPVA